MKKLLILLAFFALSISVNCQMSCISVGSYSVSKTELKLFEIQSKVFRNHLIINYNQYCQIADNPKYLRETTGFCRDHKITGWVKDTVWNEWHTVYSFEYKAKITIYREGVDGIYEHKIDKSVYENNDEAIKYLWQLEDFRNFVIIDK